MYNNYKNLILNYIAGARGDFVLSCLLNLDIKLTENKKTIVSKNMYNIKGFEKDLLPKSKQKKYDDRILNAFYDYLMKNNFIFPQSCHWVSILNVNQLEEINKKFKVYQIIIEEEYWNEVAFFNYIKNIIEKNIGNIEKDNFKKMITNFHLNFIDQIDEVKKYHNLIKDKPYNILYYSKLVKEPYEDYINLYEKLNGSKPNIEDYKLRLDKSQLPKYINISGIDIEIDIENYTIKAI